MTTYHSQERKVEVDSDLPRLVDEIDSISPPAEPLSFPLPTFGACCQTNILARDHGNGETHSIKALVKRQQSDSAYFLKQVISKSEDGKEKTWVAAVLRAVNDNRRRSSTNDDSQSRCGVEWETTGELVAIRVSSWKKLCNQNKHELIQELSALQYIGSSNNHAHGCLEVLKDDRSVYTILPYNPQGRLSASGLLAASTMPRNSDGVLKPNEDRARSLFKQLCSGLLHLQHKGIYHGNICLKSLLLMEDETLVIGDLGRSVRVPFSDPFNPDFVVDASESEQRRLIRNVQNRGSAKYQAPEVGGVSFDAFAADVWSAGVVLFVLLTGITPFKRPKLSDAVFKLVSKGDLRMLLESWNIDLSEEASDLLQNMFWRNPLDRMNLNEIFQHPWFTGETGQKRNATHSQSTTSGPCALPQSNPKMAPQKHKVKEEEEEKLNKKRRKIHSLQRELVLRTCSNSKQVRFGVEETIVYDSSTSATAAFGEYTVIQEGRRAPTISGHSDEDIQSLQDDSNSSSGDSRKTEASTKRKRRALRRIVRSASKTLKGMLCEKFAIEGPLMVSARTA